LVTFRSGNFSVGDGGDVIVGRVVGEKMERLSKKRGEREKMQSDNRRRIKRQKPETKTVKPKNS